MFAKSLGTVLSVCLIAFCIRAEERTWSGGGGNANWSTPANWGGTAPTTNDTLTFSGTARLASVNDLPKNTPIAGINFSSNAGAFTLSGNQITLNGDVGNLSAVGQIIGLPVILSGTRIFSSSEGAITVNGALSGAGGLTKIGAQPLTLTASNSYDGVTTINNGMLAVTHNNALGSTNGNTVVNSKSVAIGGGFLQLSGNIVVPEPLTLYGERNQPAGIDRHSLLNASGSNTLSGAIFRKSGGNNTRIHLNSGSHLNITGGVTGGGATLFVMRADNATLAFYGKPLNIGNDQLWTETKGTIVFGAAGNVWGGSSNLGNAYTVRMEVSDALAIGTPMPLGFSVADSLTLDMNGFDQRIGKLYSAICTSGTRIITTPTPATLTVDQSVDTHLDARLTGPLTLIKTGIGSLTLSNSVANTTTATGDITVSNGTLVVAAPKGLGNSTNVTVAGGTLELRTSESIKDTASLYITNNGAQVKISSGLTETVDKLFLDGIQQVGGTWGTTASGAAHIDDTRFAGTGTLYVLSSPPISVVNATWDGEGSDTLASTPLNWVGDTLPAFDGTTHAIFSLGGATATVDTPLNLYGITFNSTNAFTVDSGSGAMTLGAGGITAAIPDTLSRTYSLAADVTLSENQTWSVSTNGAGVTTLAIAGAISAGIDPFSIIKSGDGVLALSGNNSYDCVTYLNNGQIAISHDNALGSTVGGTIIADKAWMQMSGGIAVAEALTLPSDASTSFQGGLRVTGGSNVWSGKIKSSLSNSRIVCNGGSLDIIGGIEGGQIALGGLGGAFLKVAEKPITIPGYTLFSHASIPVILAMTNNAWSSLSISGNDVRMGMENVLPASAGLTLGYGPYSKAGIDLNGYNQSVGHTQTANDSPEHIVYSHTPATLTVNQNDTSTFAARITEAVSLVKTGTGTLTLSGASSTYGSYIVSNGTLAVSSTGTLGVNSTNIVVAGGTLSLSNSAAISDSATLTIANNGSAKVELAAGVNESVGYLYFNDKQQRAGTYSAVAGSGIQRVDTEHFAGTGILTVRHDSSGTVIILH